MVTLSNVGSLLHVLLFSVSLLGQLSEWVAMEMRIVFTFNNVSLIVLKISLLELIKFLNNQLV